MIRYAWILLVLGCVADPGQCPDPTPGLSYQESVDLAVALAHAQCRDLERAAHPVPTPEEMENTYRMPREWIRQGECRQWRDDARAYFEVKNQLEGRLWDCAVSACNLAGWDAMPDDYQDDCTQSYLDGRDPWCGAPAGDGGP